MKIASVLHCRVRFRIIDVRVPTPSEVMSTLFENEMIEGEVVDYSDTSNSGSCFVVVQVRDLPPLLVVPVGKIGLIESNHG